MYTGYVIGINTKNSNGTKSNVDGSDINRFDYGFIVGASYYFKNNLFLEFKYNNGLSDLDNTKQSDPFIGDIKSFYKNRTLHFGIGYKLN